MVGNGEAVGLEGLHVLELHSGATGGTAAGIAGRLLADLGATVVKVEPPQGDTTRQRGPFKGGFPNPEASGAFLFLHANKRSLALDLGSAEVQHELARLAAHTHLIIHDWTPAEMSLGGLDYATLSAGNPALVMLSLTPFGQSGPYRNWAATDLTLTHGGGWGWLCPGRSEQPDQPPIKPFGQHVLVQAGVHGTTAALAAVRAAARTGQGEHIDLSVQEVVVNLMGRFFGGWSYAHQEASRLTPGFYEPYAFYPCQDGWVFLITPENEQFKRLVELMGSPTWATDELCNSRPARKVAQKAIKQHIMDWTRTQRVEDVFHVCQQRRVGAAPLYTSDALAQQEHLVARNFFVPHSHPDAGGMLLPGAPYKLRDPWWAIRRPAPRLGEANADAEALFAKGSPFATDAAATMQPPNRLPLEGVRVLDLGWVWAGPHATQILSFLGAEVIKVESSSRMDLTRRSELYADGLEPGPNRCGYFNTVNQGKRSITVNLRSPEGVQIVRDLAKHCDAMISNYSTGVVERLGLGVDAMQAINPQLIVCTVSAFGQTGPQKAYVGYGPLITPLAGISARTGYAGGPPEDVGMAYGDPNGGAYAAVAIAAALLARERPDGTARKGQVIDLSMWEAMINTGFETWMAQVQGEALGGPMGNHDTVWSPHNCFRCAADESAEDESPDKRAPDKAAPEHADDAWIAIACTTEAEWRALCVAMGQPSLADSPRFATAALRKEHEEALEEKLSAWTRQHPRWALAERLQDAGVPAMPSLSASDLTSNPHLAARDFFNHPEHPEVGQRNHPGVPWKLTHGANGLLGPAPQLGGDTDAVLQDLLGLSASDCARLREQGALE